MNHPRSTPARTAARLSRLAAAMTLSLSLGACANDTPEALVAKGREAFAKGDLPAAEIHLKNALRLRAGDAQAQLALAELYARVLDWPSAAKEAERALSADPGSERAAALLLEGLGGSQPPDKVLARADALDAKTPGLRAVVQLRRGIALDQLGRRAEARRAFEAALEADPASAAARAGLIGLDASEKGAAAALSEADALVAAQPQSIDALWIQSHLRQLNGDLRGAVEPVRRIVDLWPQHFVARQRLARLQFMVGEVDESEANLGRVLARIPGWAEALSLKSEIALRRGKLDEARDAYLQAAKTEPDALAVLRVGASVALARGETGIAETLAAKLQAAAPKGDPEGLKLLVLARLAKGDPAGAIETLRPVLERPDAPAWVPMLAGDGYLRLGQPARALPLLQRAAARAPSDAGVLTMLGAARAGVRDFDGAAQALTKAAELDAQGTRADQALVDLLTRRGDAAGAEAALQRLAAKPRGAAVASMLRARAAIGAGRLEDARAELERAAAADADLFEPVAALASLDVARNDLPAAGARFDAFLKAHPGDPRALVGQVELAMRAGKLDDARKRVAQALEAAPDVEAVQLAAFRVDLAARKPADAIPRLQAALQRRPDRPVLLEALATAQAANGEREQVVATLDKLARTAPDDLAIQMRVAQLRLSAGDNPGALAAYRTIGRRSGDAIPPRIGEAATLVRMGKPAEAQAVLKEVQRRVPDAGDAAIFEGEALALGGDWQGAAAAYRRADKLHPNRPPLLIRLHQALERAGSKAEAKALLDARVAGEQVPVELLKYAGEQAIAVKDFERAARLLERAVARDPNDPVALNNFAWAKVNTKNPDALATAQRAYDLDPTRPEVADTLGFAMLQNGQVDRALPLLMQAAAAAPRSPDIRLRAIEALVRSGDKATARREIDRLIADFPSSDEAARARELGARL